MRREPERVRSGRSHLRSTELGTRHSSVAEFCVSIRSACRRTASVAMSSSWIVRWLPARTSWTGSVPDQLELTSEVPLRRRGTGLRRFAAGRFINDLLRRGQGVQIAASSAPEQQRIVGILDEAFEGIATAKANAEKNLQNARALFESHLDPSSRSAARDGWRRRWRKYGRMQDGLDAKDRHQANYAGGLHLRQAR